MAENSGIEWTHHTFNPVVGCTKISPACDNCYAETWAKRSGAPELWNGTRRKTKTWGMPVKWNKEAGEKGIRYRVFCASLADVFDNQWEEQWRTDLWALIKTTPNLDWLLLTKRPQNIKKMLPTDWGSGWPNVWLGVTIENQEEANRRLPHFMGINAAVKFLSCEPLLGPLDLEYPDEINPKQYCCSGASNECGCYGQPTSPPLLYDINWVIAGGESGPNFRAGNIDWFRSLRDQCVVWSVPFLFKQYEGPSTAAIKKLGRELDGVVWDQYPNMSP